MYIRKGLKLPQQHLYTFSAKPLARAATMSNRDISGATRVKPGCGFDKDSESTRHQPVNPNAEAKTLQEQPRVFDCGQKAWLTVAGT